MATNDDTRAGRPKGTPLWVAIGFLGAFAATVLTVILTGLYVRAPRSASSGEPRSEAVAEPRASAGGPAETGTVREGGAVREGGTVREGGAVREGGSVREADIPRDDQGDAGDADQ
jgi:hypothetical protein